MVSFSYFARVGSRFNPALGPGSSWTRDGKRDGWGGKRTEEEESGRRV